LAVLTRLRHSRSVGLIRYHLYRDVLLARPRRRACNICGWRGRRFLTYGHKFVLCPCCGSQIRHRMIAAALDWHEVRRRTPIDGARLLHISPEYCLGLVLRSRARQYVRADWATADADVRQDITRMPFAAGAFDIVVASDVLEHVSDDRAALAECRRVLRAGGVAILTVPQSDDLEATDENAAADSPERRAREYGQADHLRNYGSDFARRLGDAGFRVICIDSGAFDRGIVERHVLRPPIPLRERWGWNNRRVYFAEAV
jgi:SAM-dependent methyltransferase